jgi:hypothetical protein
MTANCWFTDNFTSAGWSRTGGNILKKKEKEKGESLEEKKEETTTGHCRDHGRVPTTSRERHSPRKTIIYIYIYEITGSQGVTPSISVTNVPRVRRPWPSSTPKRLDP